MTGRLSHPSVRRFPVYKDINNEFHREILEGLNQKVTQFRCQPYPNCSIQACIIKKEGHRKDPHISVCHQPQDFNSVIPSEKLFCQFAVAKET